MKRRKEKQLRHCKLVIVAAPGVYYSSSNRAQDLKVNYPVKNFDGAKNTAKQIKELIFKQLIRDVGHPHSLILTST